MNTYKTFNFDTASGMLSLSCIDIEEPNNGRMLYKVKLQLDGTDITEAYFGNWNYINFSISNYESVSPDKKWIYIPMEGNHFLINSLSLDKSELPYLSVSAATFRGNMFVGDFILIISSHEIISKNLKTGSVYALQQPDANTYFRGASLQPQNQILLELSDATQMSVSTQLQKQAYDRQ